MSHTKKTHAMAVDPLLVHREATMLTGQTDVWQYCYALISLSCAVTRLVRAHQGCADLGCLICDGLSEALSTFAALDVTHPGTRWTIGNPK